MQNLNGPQVAFGEGEAGRSDGGVGGTGMKRAGSTLCGFPGRIGGLLIHIG